jgi:hypothetical protein
LYIVVFSNAINVVISIYITQENVDDNDDDDSEQRCRRRRTQQFCCSSCHTTTTTNAIFAFGRTAQSPQQSRLQLLYASTTIFSYNNYRLIGYWNDAVDFGSIALAFGTFDVVFGDEHSHHESFQPCKQ